jgi:hypothetical protein
MNLTRYAPAPATLSALFVALMLPGCNPGSTGTDPANGSDNGGENGGNGGADPIPYCQVGCTTASDCTSVENGAFNADNYACSQGACQYTGCGSDAECDETYSATGVAYLCRDTYDIGTRFCQQACTVAADCVPAASGWDEAHYTCLDGACRYDGCTTDELCQARQGSAGGTWGCRDLEGSSDCRQLCTTNADCGFPGAGDQWDSDNYECSADGVCVYAGCGSDAECNSITDGNVCLAL